jgi:GNAT superfamily N-acetyltransferase
MTRDKGQMTITIVEDSGEALNDFIALLDEVGTWLWHKGVKQWAPGCHQQNRDEIQRLVNNGCLILAYDDDQLAGGCVLSHDKPELWAGYANHAMYLSSLVVARFAAGTGLGSQIMALAVQATIKRGKSCIRLDCWDGNDFLKSYYQREGFAMLAAVQEHDYFVRRFEKTV